jgi:hypothetical protein
MEVTLKKGRQRKYISTPSFLSPLAIRDMTVVYTDESGQWLGKRPQNFPVSAGESGHMEGRNILSLDCCFRIIFTSVLRLD